MLVAHNIKIFLAWSGKINLILFVAYVIINSVKFNKNLGQNNDKIPNIGFVGYSASN